MLKIKKIAAKAVEKVASNNVGIACPHDWHQPKVPKKLMQKSK